MVTTLVACTLFPPPPPFSFFSCLFPYSRVQSPHLFDCLQNVVFGLARARMSVLALVIAAEISLYYLLCERRGIALVSNCGSTPAGLIVFST